MLHECCVTVTKVNIYLIKIVLLILKITCFICSNIQEFCCYFKKLPSLEGVRGSNGRRISYRTMRFDESEALMTEELRKVLISLDNADKVAISPESLFSVIWKVVPRFR
jgi:ubiquitin carboxyl-terminal hydrolase 3